MRTLVKTITKKDFKIEFLKTGGPGGQHRNKVETAVRITHIESGLSVVAGDSKSQARNKAEAFRRLVKKMEPWIRETYALKKKVQNSQVTVRRYNKKQDRVVDMRIKDEVFSFDDVINGDGLNRVIIRLKGEAWDETGS
jgi:peptide chain release factor 1